MWLGTSMLGGPFNTIHIDYNMIQYHFQNWPMGSSGKKSTFDVGAFTLFKLIFFLDFDWHMTEWDRDTKNVWHPNPKLLPPQTFDLLKSRPMLYSNFERQQMVPCSWNCKVYFWSYPWSQSKQKASQKNILYTSFAISSSTFWLTWQWLIFGSIKNRFMPLTNEVANAYQ